MKKIIIYAWALAATILAWGCTREQLQEVQGQGEVVFRVALDGLATRATSAGTEAEDAVNCLDIFIFDENGTQLFHLHPTSIQQDAQATDYYVAETSLGTIRDALQYSTDQATLEKLLQAQTLAIANYPGSTSDFENLSLTQVMALTVDAAYTANDASNTGKFLSEDNGTYRTLSSPSFVMKSARGGFQQSNGVVLSNLTLQRLAAKVTLSILFEGIPITTSEEIDGNSPYAPLVSSTPLEVITEWTPNTSSTRIYLDNGARQASLNGPVNSPASFQYADGRPTGNPMTSSAFYTYPLEWQEGSDREPFLKIVQPWSYKRYFRDGQTNVYIDENEVELYYKVMFPGLTELKSNTWYKPSVTLSVLGGEVDDPLPLTATALEILDWGTGAAAPVTLAPPAYLIPETQTLTVHSGQTARIYFTSTATSVAELSLVPQSIYKEVFRNDRKETLYFYNNGAAISGSSDSYDPSWVQMQYDSNSKEGYIELNHTLTDDFTANTFSSRPYIYEYKLSLTGTNESKDIKFIQYPPLTVDGILSSGWVCINGEDADHGYEMYNYSNNNYEYRFPSSTYYVNGYQPRTSSQGSYSKPYVLLPGNRNNFIGGSSNANYTTNRYIHTYWYDSTPLMNPASNNNYDLMKVNNLGTVWTYDYLNPDAAKNTCRWMIVVSPTTSSDRNIMDPRIDISLNQPNDNGLYEILNMHSKSISQYNPQSNTSYIYDGSPLSADPDDISNIKKYKPTKKLTMISDVDNADPQPGTAPEVMFASSYGKNTSVNYLAAVLRCAAYQEDGYPAGRWRLPTETELELAIKLFKKGAIPNLFDGIYWSASGRHYDSQTEKWSQPTNAEFLSSTNNTAIGVRCVYDTWYWGRDEVAALRTQHFGNTTYAQYRWSGYGYTHKPDNQQ